MLQNMSKNEEDKIPSMVAKKMVTKTNLDQGESCLFDALSDDGADASRSHKIELGKLLWMLMTSVWKSALLFLQIIHVFGIQMM